MEYVVKYLNYLQYNSVVTLTFFFISLLVLFLNNITKGKSNKWLFMTYRDKIYNPLVYIRLFTHTLGHSNWSHFYNNFLYILILGPMLEEKYGSDNILILILVTSLITGLVTNIFTKKRVLGSSGIVYMFIILSSFVNIESGKIPITLILVFLFYIVNEIKDGLFKKDDTYHLGHIIGAICGCIFGLYIL